MSQLKQTKELLPVIEPERNKDINCGNCIGACCLAGTIIPLTPDEKTQLESAGTELARYNGPPQRPPSRAQKVAALLFGKNLASKDLYTMESNCGNLTVGEDGSRKCADYENRPGICRVFKPGANNCLELRLARGVDEPSQQQVYRQKNEAGDI